MCWKPSRVSSGSQRHEERYIVKSLSLMKRTAGIRRGGNCTNWLQKPVDDTRSKLLSSWSGLAARKGLAAGKGTRVLSKVDDKRTKREDSPWLVSTDTICPQQGKAQWEANGY